MPMRGDVGTLRFTHPTVTSQAPSEVAVRCSHQHDGLAGDLAKLCGVSGVSADIYAAAIPLSKTATELLDRGVVGIEAIVSGGDDYEILCTVPEKHFEAFVKASEQAGVAVISIGIITAGDAAPRFLDGQGKPIALSRLSYSHF